MCKPHKYNGKTKKARYTYTVILFKYIMYNQMVNCHKTMKKSQKMDKYNTLLFRLLFFKPACTLEVTGELFKK